MNLVTLDIDKKRNLIIQFPVFIQPYTQQPFIWYQLEMVPVPVVDKNHQGGCIYRIADLKPMHNIKHWNVYKHQATRISNMQENRVLTNKTTSEHTMPM